MSARLVEIATLEEKIEKLETMIEELEKMLKECEADAAKLRAEVSDGGEDYIKTANP